MTISRKQSYYVPTWATGGLYPITPNIWAGMAMRVAIAGAEAAAGVEPAGQLGAQYFNFLQGVELDHLAALVDSYAINWPEAGSTETDALQSHTILTYGTLIASSKIGGLGGYYESWLWVCDQRPLAVYSGTGECFRSRDGVHWAIGGAPASFDGQPVDVLGWGSKAVLLTNDGTTCRVWFSSNAAFTWSAGPFSLPDPGSHPDYDRVAWIESANRYVTAGAGCLATSPDLVTWTIRTDGLGAQSPFGVACIAVAGEDETGVGVIIPRSNSNVITWSLDGVTFEDRTVGSAGFAGACWSEVHLAWFAINVNGQLYKSEDLTDNWTLVADMYGPSGSSFTRPGVTLQAFGKNLVVLGEQIRLSSTAGVRCGNVLVYDPTNAYGYALNPNSGYDAERPFDRLVRHDGRLVAARTSDYTSPFYVHLAMSLRAPWVVE